MSTVNLTEALIVVEYRRPAAAVSLQALLTGMPIDFVAPTTQHAFITARARQRFPVRKNEVDHVHAGTVLKVISHK